MSAEPSIRNGYCIARSWRTQQYGATTTRIQVPGTRPLVHAVKVTNGESEVSRHFPDFPRTVGGERLDRMGRDFEVVLTRSWMTWLDEVAQWPSERTKETCQKCLEAMAALSWEDEWEAPEGVS